MSPLLLALAGTTPASATTTWWQFEAAYDNVAEGAWYQGYDNESATLAWGQSYVMMALVSMFRATGDPLYLDRLAEHLDAVLAMRDDQRGVTDYRGESAACWRDIYYQPEPYCYIVHSGMIALAYADFALAVSQADIGDHLAADGETFEAKAARYTTAAEEVVAAHEDQWRDEGFYVFREDASFLDYAGVDVPFNQSSALGRVLLALYQVTGDTAHGDKVVALAERFRDDLTVGPSGEYLWNYWGGTYVADGEDISHAFINVAFAAEVAEAGLTGTDGAPIFDDDDMWAFSETLMANVYVDDATIATYVGGGLTNYSSYPLSFALFADLTPWRTSIYTVSRDLYEEQVVPEALGSGWLLLGWALLAEHAPPVCPHFFYTVDWDTGDGWRQATAYSANFLTIPPDLEEPCIVPLEVLVTHDVVVRQWDDVVYHDVARWTGSGVPSQRWVPYEPAYQHVYWADGVLFHFGETFVDGEGVWVREPDDWAAPTITSTAPDCSPGEAVSYTPTAVGTPPLWWSLVDRPVDARVDAATGTLSWTAGADCTADFTLRVTNDVGSDVQSWSWTPHGGGDTGTSSGDTGTSSGDTGPPSGDDSGEPDDNDGGSDGQDSESPTDTPVEAGCGCSVQTASPAAGGALGALLALVAMRRRERADARPDPQRP